MVIDFVTPVDDVNVYGLPKLLGIPKLDVDAGNITCFIEWRLGVEARSWGIKSIDVHVTKVTALFEWEVYAGDLTEEEKAKLIAAGGREYRNNTIGGTIEVVSSEKWNGSEWKIDSDFGLSEDGMCCPQDAEIDFEAMKINIL